MKTPTFNDVPSILGQLLEKVENLENRFSSHQSNNEPDHWMTIEELMKYVPGNPAKQTIYGWVHRKQVPFHKRGKKLLFLKSEIDAWLKSNVQPNYDFSND